MTMISRRELHSKFCSLYGEAADIMGLPADCVCQSYDEMHERAIMVDDRPVDWIRSRIVSGGHSGYRHTKTVHQGRRTMKKLIDEVENEGLISLMGERVTFFGLNYIYTGKLVGVNETCVKLENAAIVYETGGFKEPSWKDAQELPHPVYVLLRCVESYMVLK